MTEKEYKVLLSKEQYMDIDDYFAWDEEFVQTNFYYNDEDNYILDHDITVRIRQKCNKILLQTKVLKRKENALVIKEEKERNVKMVMEEIPENILAEMLGFKCSEIRKIGSLKTRRKIFRGFQDTVVCLDYNEYLRKKDYELEIEFFSPFLSEEVRKAFENDLDVSFDEKSLGKNSRFFREYLKKL